MNQLSSTIYVVFSILDFLFVLKFMFYHIPHPLWPLKLFTLWLIDSFEF